MVSCSHLKKKVEIELSIDKYSPHYHVQYQIFWIPYERGTTHHIIHIVGSEVD